VAGSDLGPGLGAEPGEISVEFPLQFVIENDAEVPAALVEDFPGLFLIQPLEICIVVCFFRFDETVVSRLTFANKPIGAYQPVSVFGERQQVPWVSEICCCFGVLYLGEVSSETCPLLILMGENLF
jgi:hypothetical protein